MLGKLKLSSQFKLAVLIIAPILIGFFALCLGRYMVTPKEVGDVLLQQVFGMAKEVPDVHLSVVWNIRLPRILLALLVGMGLAVSGAAFQGLFSNPLATPDTLGVAAGASFGAALGILLFENIFVVQL